VTFNESPDAYAHAAATLEFGTVLDLIASLCANDAARARVRALAPTSDRAAIEASLGEIEAYRAMSDEHGDVPVGETSCRGDLERVGDRRESVAPADLLAIAAAERAAGELARALERAEAPEPLSSIAAGIHHHGDVVDAVERAIDVDGSIKDTASPALRAIRRDVHDLRASLRSLSEKLVGDYGGESMGTMLGERYVVLVPRAKIRRKTGLVHSTSHTGGSLYFEPFNLVDRNNDLEARLADERAEEARILDDLRDRLAACADDLLANLDIVDRFDAIRARARFCAQFHCTTPEVSATGRLRLRDARHPVLVRLLGDQGGEQVPLGLTLEPDHRLMVITGPNAGGKTVALKTVGVCALLFQCGIQVPCASGSELPVFHRMLVDIGDEQSMESSLSTFTSHLRHLDEMIRRADADTLCLVDEIGDGTDPDEGAALAIATLERLLDSGAAVIATTHYGRIKTFALEAEGVTNASMAFEDGAARPLYRLLQGVAGRSRGLETAERSGFDPEVATRARSYVGRDAFQLDAVLSKLETTLRGLEEERETVKARFAELERLIAEYKRKASEYDLTRKEAMRKASREAAELLEETRREAEAVVREIRETQAERRAIREGRRRLDEMAGKTRGAMRAARPEPGPLESVAVGDRVAVSKSGSPVGEVVEVKKGTATVEIAGKRIRLRIDSLFRPSADTPGAGVSYDYDVEPLGSTELDVRGHDREEAIEAVTRFIDQAVYTGVREVKIIHGVGTGVLARAVAELLRTDHRVESTRPGEQVEGGMGVTIVSLAG
jgi:DNA mismatch repair protein MutS2